MAQTTETKEGKSHFSDTWDKEIYSLPTMPLTVINVVRKVKAPIACSPPRVPIFVVCVGHFVEVFVLRVWWAFRNNRIQSISFPPLSLLCITSWSSVAVAVQMSGGDLKHGRHTSPRFSSVEVTSSWWTLQYLLILQRLAFWWMYHFGGTTGTTESLNLPANRPSRHRV